MNRNTILCLIVIGVILILLGPILHHPQPTLAAPTPLLENPQLKITGTTENPTTTGTVAYRNVREVVISAQD